MLKAIDNLLNQTTMYRLVVYYLAGLLAVAALLSVFGRLPFNVISLISSTAILLAVCWLVNKIIALLFRVPVNVESAIITALILALIITPIKVTDAVGSDIWFLVWAGILAMSSKFILNISNKHIFNPAAVAIFITSLALGQSASWWVGSSPMFLFVVLGGFLIIKKVQRWDAVIAFLGAVVMVLIFLGNQANVLSLIGKALFASPIIFFAVIMLTEPLTMPPTSDGRIAYGILTGWLFAPLTHFGPIYLTPEAALLIGNIFSYLISPKQRLILKLKEKNHVAWGVYDFVFQVSRPFKFKPGQYLEWTLGHQQTDSRGNRRYFTIASAPTERNLIMGVKFYNQPSSFKKRLFNLKPGDPIIAGQLAGDFVLPDKPKKKLAFIAGGIGLTPFRSMLQYLSDAQERRDIVVFNSNKTVKEMVYQDVLQKAQNLLGIKVVNAITDEAVPAESNLYQGFLNDQIIKQAAPDYLERLFYISGSHAMVEAMKNILLKMGVKRSRIKTDFFPGLA